MLLGVCVMELVGGTDGDAELDGVTDGLTVLLLVVEGLAVRELVGLPEPTGVRLGVGEREREYDGVTEREKEAELEMVGEGVSDGYAPQRKSTTSLVFRAVLSALQGSKKFKGPSTRILQEDWNRQDVSSTTLVSTESHRPGA